MDIFCDHWLRKPPYAISISGTELMVHPPICTLLRSKFICVCKPPGVLQRWDSTVMWNTITSLGEGMHVHMHSFFTSMFPCSGFSKLPKSLLKRIFNLPQNVGFLELHGQWGECTEGCKSMLLWGVGDRHKQLSCGVLGMYHWKSKMCLWLLLQKGHCAKEKYTSRGTSSIIISNSRLSWENMPQWPTGFPAILKISPQK